MTEQEVTALKGEISKAVDAAIQPDMTRDAAVKAVCDAVGALSAPKEMGGMGMDQGMGDMESMAEDQGEGGQEE